MEPIRSEDDARRVFADSQDRPVLVFKHSTACPISAAARKEVEDLSRASDTDIRIVRVIEERPASNYIEVRSGVQHESPQALLLRDGEVAWHASHRAITHEALQAALRE